MGKILNGKDLAARDGMKTYREWLMKRSEQLARKGLIEMAWDGEAVIEDEADAVEARIDYGRWIADCPDCGGAEYVDVEDGIFFCLSCGNKEIGGKARRVIFPKDREKIEELLLERPVEERGGNVFQRAMTAKVVVGRLQRSWMPGEKREKLEKENRIIKEGKDGL